MYTVSLKSETVGFNSLGDLTQNDPIVIRIVSRGCRIVTTLICSCLIEKLSPPCFLARPVTSLTGHECIWKGG